MKYGDFISVNGLLFTFIESRTTSYPPYYERDYEVWDCNLVSDVNDADLHCGINHIWGDTYTIEIGIVDEYEVLGKTDPRSVEGAGI